MSNINKQALLIENGQLVADTLRHLANNEIDSDYFAIVSESENGTEIEHELAITDYALQAAGTVDELAKALEAAEKRIAELEAREVVLHKRSVGEVMHMSGFDRQYAEGWCAGNDNAIHEIHVAGISIKGE